MGLLRRSLQVWWTSQAECADELGTVSVAQATDAALARRAGLGDAEAFSELFTRHWFATFRYAMRMLNNEQHVAQDAAQEAWAAAWRGATGFKNQSSFRTWVFTITYREALKQRKQRRPQVVDDETVHQMLDDHSAASRPLDGSPEAAFSHLELHQALSLALAELPWRQRAAWLLREMEGLAYDEIADVLGTSPTVVRGQLHRARKALNVRLESWR